jgi:Domain of unknown function (DUF4082)
MIHCLRERLNFVLRCSYQHFGVSFLHLNTSTQSIQGKSMFTFFNPFKQKKFYPKMTEGTSYGKESSIISTLLGTHSPCKLSSIVFACMAMSFSVPGFAADQLKAFACAQGFGANAKGGRGGDVYHVTKLSDNGSVGTLRYGIEKAKGSRTIVFDVGGIIHLKAILNITTDNMTIAGQTAPGGGITLAGSRFGITRSSNVIVRYMRFRIGDYNARYGKWGAPDKGPIIGNGNKHMYGEGGDALIVFKSDNVILDHVSASWGMDETVDLAQSTNITFQHSIISETFLNSFHFKGKHSRGIIINGGASAKELARGRGGVTFYQNLLANNNVRNPVLSTVQGENSKFLGVDFANNVVYNWGEESGHPGKTRHKMNFVNNYLIAGPSTQKKNLKTAMRKSKSYGGVFYIYQSGNYMDTDKDPKHDGKPVGREAFPRFKSNEYVSKPFPWPAIDKVYSAEGAYQNILSNVGASIVRDNVDTRIIKEVKTRTGKIIDSQKDVGGLKPLAKGKAPVDTDRDGMPDNWEIANGLEPKNALDRNRTNLSNDGYTNLEVYLDSIVESAGHCAADGKKVQAQKNQSPKNSNNSSNSSNNKSNLSSVSRSIWNAGDVPITASEKDANSVELGVKFKSDEDGVIKGIRFFKGKGNTGKHVGNLWTSKGKLLATATFTNETATGWQQVNFSEPVTIYKDTVYVASYHAPRGHYASDEQFFTDAGIDNGPLHLLKTGVSGKNGLFSYSKKSTFPKSTYLSTNYWVDVVFNKIATKQLILANYYSNLDLVNSVSLGSTCCSIWDEYDAPVNASEKDPGAVELGVKFMSAEDGFIEGIRFYKGKGNTGRHIGSLWTSRGKRLASATFTNETASGWQQVKFAKPIAIKKDTVYVASYHAPKGHYANDKNAFAKSGFSNGSLRLLKTGVSGKNGVYTYARKSTFPRSTYFSSNYWVDVIFNNQFVVANNN